MKFLELDNSENSVGQHFEKQRSRYLQKSIMYLLGEKKDRKLTS